MLIVLFFASLATAGWCFLNLLAAGMSDAPRNAPTAAIVGLCGGIIGAILTGVILILEFIRWLTSLT